MRDERLDMISYSRNLLSRRIHCPAKSGVTSVGFDFQGHFVTYKLHWMGERRAIIHPPWMIDKQFRDAYEEINDAQTVHMCDVWTPLCLIARKEQRILQIGISIRRKVIQRSPLSPSPLLLWLSCLESVVNVISLLKKAWDSPTNRVPSLKESEPTHIC